MKFSAYSKFAFGCVTIAFLIQGCGKNSASSDSASTTDSSASSQGGATIPDKVNDAGTTQQVADFDAFIPEGYVPLDTAYGNLNLDGADDAILILRDKRELTVENGEESRDVDMEWRRPVLILTRQNGQGWKLEGRNDHLALCQSCGGVLGDPYVGITIKDGYFSIEHYGGSNWRWSRIMTFKYSPEKKAWFLHKDGGDSYHTSDPDKVTSDVRTTKDFGVVPFEAYNESTSGL